MNMDVHSHQLLEFDVSQASQGFACIVALEAVGIWLFLTS